MCSFLQRSNYDFLFNYFIQRIACINIININDNLLKIILHSLNNKKRMSFFKNVCKAY